MYFASLPEVPEKAHSISFDNCDTHFHLISFQLVQLDLIRLSLPEYMHLI